MSALGAWLEKRDTPLVWLDFEAYAAEVFAGGSARYLADPTRAARALAEARHVLDVSVVTLDAWAPFAATTPAGPGSPAEAAEARFDAAEPRAWLEETLRAVAGSLGDAELVLTVPAPGDVLRALGAAANVALDLDDLDDVADALARLLRSLAEFPVTGLRIAFAAPREELEAELEACDPLANIASHYRWVSACAFSNLGAAAPNNIALSLYEEVPIAELLPLWEAGRPVGGGLGSAFWSRDAALPPLPGGALLYGRVPSALAPEQILERARTLARPLR